MNNFYENNLRLILNIFLLVFIFCSPVFSQQKNIKTAVLVINSINVFEKSQLGNDILVSFQEAALALKKEAKLNVKKFEDEELELTKKRENLAKEEFNKVADDFDNRFNLVLFFL